MVDSVKKDTLNISAELEQLERLNQTLARLRVWAREAELRSELTHLLAKMLTNEDRQSVIDYLGNGQDPDQRVALERNGIQITVGDLMRAFWSVKREAASTE